MRLMDLIDDIGSEIDYRLTMASFAIDELLGREQEPLEEDESSEDEYDFSEGEEYEEESDFIEDEECEEENDFIEDEEYE